MAKFGLFSVDNVSCTLAIGIFYWGCAYFMAVTHDNHRFTHVELGVSCLFVITGFVLVIGAHKKNNWILMAGCFLTATIVFGAVCFFGILAVCFVEPSPYWCDPDIPGKVIVWLVYTMLQMWFCFIVSEARKDIAKELAEGAQKVVEKKSTPSFFGHVDTAFGLTIANLKPSSDTK